MCGLFCSPTVPPGLSMCKCGATGSASLHLVGSASCSLAHPVPQSATLLDPPATTLPPVLSAQLQVSAPPTSVDESVFFISLVVGLPYSPSFSQFWVFLVFKLLLSFFWVCEKAQCVYVHLHLCWKPINIPLVHDDDSNICISIGMFLLSVLPLGFQLHCVLLYA